MKVARFKLNEERENLFSLYQVVYPEVLSKLVGSRIHGLEQEVPLRGKKVDIGGWAKDIKQDIYVEVQLIPADIRHMESVKKIISEIDKGIVIWEALSFDRRENLVNEVIRFSKNFGKDVDLLFVEINSDVILILERLVLLHPFEVVPNLGRLSEVRKPFKKIKEYKGIDVIEVPGERQNNGVKAVRSLWRRVLYEPFRHEPVSLSARLGANQYVLMRIREKMPFFLGAYRAKSRLDTNALTFGAGDGNIFEISIRDSYSRVKLRIARKNESVFTELRIKKTFFEDSMGYKINFRVERSSFLVDIPIQGFGRPREKVLDEVVEIFKMFVKLYIKWFYPRNRENNLIDIEAK